MEKQETTEGRCGLCKGVFSKAGMAKHLESCKEKNVISKSPEKVKVFHLLVEGSDLPEYWIHLDVRAASKLEDLDLFLRNVWLECCGHMSAFTIQGKDYTSGEKSMNTRLYTVLRPGMEFYYEYDFGTPTALRLKVLSEQAGDQGDRTIQFMARNLSPMIKCESCGEVAAQVCCNCIYSGEGWLCNKCSSKHECGEEMLLPVVNSPRVGMCGYTG